MTTKVYTGAFDVTYYDLTIADIETEHTRDAVVAALAAAEDLNTSILFQDHKKTLEAYVLSGREDMEDSERLAAALLVSAVNNYITRTSALVRAQVE